MGIKTRATCATRVELFRKNYSATTATTAHGWLSPVAMRAVTMTFTIAPAGKLLKVAS